MMAMFAEREKDKKMKGPVRLAEKKRETAKHVWTYILSSKQIFGPMTLAAPETMRKAMCFSGQGADKPHLYLRGFGSAK